MLLLTIFMLNSAGECHASKHRGHRDREQQRRRSVTARLPYSEQDSIDFSKLLEEFRLSCTHGVSTEFGKDILTSFEGEFESRGKPVKVGYEELSKLLESVEKQIASLELVLSEFYGSSDSGSETEEEIAPYSSWSFFGFVGQVDEDSSSENEMDPDDAEFVSYLGVSSQLAELMDVQASLQRRLADMNAIINSRMKQRNIINHFKCHPNPKFNTSLPEGNAWVRALLKDIYCIE